MSLTTTWYSNSTMPTISAILLTYKRPDEVEGALESLLAQEPPPDEIIVYDDDPCGSGRAARGLDHPKVRYVCVGRNLGPAGARTRAAREAGGDILLYLDDDCRLEHPATTRTVLDLFQDPTIGFVAALIRNAFSGEIVPREYPGYRTAGWEQPHDVAYFVASGFAVRREVLDALGGFDDVLYHGEEELEFAFRLINSGWRMRYTPDFLIRHRVSPDGRDTIRRSYRLVRNRTYLAVKHLPWPFVLSHLIVWSCVTFLEALWRRELREFARGLASIHADRLLARAWRYRRAHPLSRTALRYLRQHEGRLWY